MRKRVYDLDGRAFVSLDAFYDEITRVLGLGWWGRNLDAFNDILRGGFGTPDGGFVLRIAHAEAARKHLHGTFDRLIEIIRVHGEGGAEAEDGVELIVKDTW